MPIYEYKCKKCDHEFDELQKIDAPDLKKCPECKKSALVKLVSAPNFRLKGSGWYETDFKKDKRRNLADDGSSSESKASGKSDSGDKTSSKKSEADSKKTASKKDSTKASAKKSDSAK